MSAPLCAKPPLDYQEPPPDPSEAGRIERPQPGQMAAPESDRLVGAAPFFRLPSVDESIPVPVSVSRDPYWKTGKQDAVLTNACRLGDFTSVSLNRLVARFDGKEGRGILAVVPPTHRFLLVDRRRLAAPDEIYYFKDSGTPDCQVWVKNPTRVRTLDKIRGTSLPKPDRNALAKRKKEIASWPQR